MSFYIQHGYGKGTKIDAVARHGRVTGVMLSPGDEERDSLRTTVADVVGQGLQPLLDPQLYVYATTPTGAARCHDSHGLAFKRVHWSQDASATEAQVRAVQAANAAVGISETLVAPTVLQSTFADVWTPLALQLARTSAAEWGSQSTIASVAIDEAALGDWRAVEDWLDVATTLDVRGFYFLVDRRRREYPPLPWDPTRLANLLRLFYRLSEINGYEVIWGYSDFEGLLGLAAGVQSVGTGWHYSLRQFNVAKWQPSTSGGQPPAARISLGRLWVAARAEAEAELIFGSAERARVFPTNLVNRFTVEPFAGWSRLDAQVQHMRTIASRAGQIAEAGPVDARVELVSDWLDQAASRFGRIARTGVVLPPSYSTRVDNFRAALAAFASSEAL